MNRTNIPYECVSRGSKGKALRQYPLTLNLEYRPRFIAHVTTRHDFIRLVGCVHSHQEEAALATHTVRLFEHQAVQRQLQCVLKDPPVRPNDNSSGSSDFEVRFQSTM